MQPVDAVTAFCRDVSNSRRSLPVNQTFLATEVANSPQRRSSDSGNALYPGPYTRQATSIDPHQFINIKSFDLRSLLAPAPPISALRISPSN